MRSSGRPAGRTSLHAPTLLVWSVNDELIEHPDLLERQFDDIRSAGFGGVAPFVRCTRYTWHDPLARQALRSIGRLCSKHRLECWIGPDPRFISGLVVPLSGGLEVLMFGDRARAEVFPNLVPVSSRRFSVRCNVSPRHVHTLQDVAIQYTPRGIERLYAVRASGGSEASLEVRDITPQARFFYNAREQYVEAFGNLPPRLKGEGWKILAFFRAATNHFDFSDPIQMKRYLDMIRTLRKEGCAADGVMWDEPGYTCTYGTLPYSPAIRKRYKLTTGRDLTSDLWRLALDTADLAHAPSRLAYYESVQRSLNDANGRFKQTVERLWGATTVSGIHDTWHFESADMCDMNHGSLDLWKAGRSKTGGFVDLGGIDRLREPDSPWYGHLATMSVICASLGKMSKGRFAYNNLWTVGDDGGEGWQATVMDHCVNTMALFGTRWLAHAYGPVGTIGEERSFLGSPPLPGYPDHSTWRFFPVWNRRLAAHLKDIEQKLPVSNVLMVFPVERLYALAGPPADRLAASFFAMILALLDEHFHVDVLSPWACEKAKWSRGEFHVGEDRYIAVIRHDPSGDHGFSPGGGNDLYAVQRAAGRRLEQRRGLTAQGVLALLKDAVGVRPVRAPEGCWATMTRVKGGTIITLMPARHGFAFRGAVTLDGRSVELPGECRALTRIFYSRSGGTEIMSGGPDFSI